MKAPRSALIILFLLVLGLSVDGRDEWTRVQSKNFLLVGNASEKDIRKVATRLEQFRETFRLLFGQMNLNAPIPTNVVVFKSDASYKNFKPKRADGRLDTEVDGFFQPGEDVNYITLSTEGNDNQTFAIIFHEYVHFIVDTNFGRSEVPAWFNEGLAEYYSTFAIEDDIRVKLGIPLSRHLYLLQQSRLMPLSELFGVTNYQLLQSGGHSRGIFYAESWAIVHYLIQSGKTAGMGNFLNSLMKGAEPQKAFRDAFDIDYSAMEAALRKYVSQGRYQYNQITFKNKLVFDADMQASPLDEGTANAYLGDLLFHTNREEDAEAFVAAAIKAHPELSLANTTLGMLRIRQQKFTDALAALEKAIAGDPRNHLAFYRYAYVLSREAMDAMGYIQHYDAATASRIREALKKAISINPSFAESYELLAFVDLVNSEDLDDAVKQLQTALKVRPGNERYLLRLSEVLVRQSKLAEAETIAKNIDASTTDEELKARSGRLLKYISEKRRYDEELAAYNRNSAPANQIRRLETNKVPSKEEVAKRQADATLRSLNQNLRKPADGEQRVIGHVQRIECRPSSINYLVKTETGTFILATKDFNDLILESYRPEAANLSVGCATSLASYNAVITFRPAQKGVARGQLVALEFVSDDFRFMTEDEMRGGSLLIYQQP